MAAPGSTRTKDVGRDFLNIYLQQGKDLQDQLAEQGRTRAQGTLAAYEKAGEALEKGAKGYVEGKRLKRAEEAHARAGTKADQETAAHKQTMEKGSLELDESKKRQGVLDTVDPKTGKSRRDTIADLDIATSEEGLAGAQSQRRLTDARTAAFGKKTPAEIEAQQQIQLEQTLDAMAGMDPSDPQYAAMNEEVARLATELRLSPGAIEAQRKRSTARVATAAEEKETSRDIRATAKAGYPELNSNIAASRADTANLMDMVADLQDYENLTTVVDSGKIEAKVQKFMASLPPEQAAQIEAKFSDFQTREERIRYVLQQQLAQIKRRARLNTSQSVDHPTLQGQAQAQERQIAEIEKILYGSPEKQRVYKPLTPSQTFQAGPRGSLR